MASTEKKIAVNGTTSAFNPTTQDNINTALLQNGGIKRIQETFQSRLDEVGWSQAVRDYVERLFRSGEAQGYDDAMKMVMSHVYLQPGEGGAKVSNGTTGPDLSIPREVAKDGACAVKKELEKVCKLEGT